MGRESIHAAVEQLEKISSDYDQWAEVYAMLVNAYYQLLRDGDYSRSPRANLDAEAEARYRLGVEQWNEGDLQGAVEHLSKVPAKRKEFESAQSNLAQICIARGHQEYRAMRWEEAIEWWNKALAISPGLEKVLRGRIRETKARIWVKHHGQEIVAGGVFVAILVCVFAVWNPPQRWGRRLAAYIPISRASPGTPTLISVRTSITITPTFTTTPTGTPTPSYTPTRTPTRAHTPTGTPTFTPTGTPSPTATPTSSPTPFPTPTFKPTEAPSPALALVATSTVTPSPIVPPVKMKAPTLLEPRDGTTFGERYADVTFRWSGASRPLQVDEYYVLIIKHRAGTDRTWTKDPWYSVADDKRWLPDEGPELKWQVVVASRRTGQPDEDPTGAELSAYSKIGVFSWGLGPGDNENGNGEEYPPCWPRC